MTESENFHSHELNW